MRGLPLRPLVVAVSAVALGCAGAANSEVQQPVRRISNQQAGTMRIRIEIEGTFVTATLDDTEVARDFVSLLPLTMTLEDYNATEKVADLPRKLSTGERRRVAIPTWATSRTTPPGATWLCSTGTSATRPGSSSSDRWMPAWRPCAGPVRLRQRSNSLRVM